MQLPQEFIRYSKELMGEGLSERLFSALEEEAPASLRLNPLKCYYMPRQPEGRVPWCNTGYYLKSRPQFTFDPLLHAGLYYVQEASSMFLHYVLRQLVREPSLVLDLCAAPGGKSTAARTILPRGSVLISNEPVRQRAQVLAENMQKFGHRDCIVTCNQPRDFQRSGMLFDVVIADVPCSGEGMFRKDPAARGEWSAENVEKCAALQRQIVSDIWGNLKPGGLLIYSTCTFNTRENEENVQWIMKNLDAEALPLFTETEWKLLSSFKLGFDEPVYRFVPGIARGEGLFMAVLRKGWNRQCTLPYNPTPYKPAPTPLAPTDWLYGDFDIRRDGDRLTAISPVLKSAYAAASRYLQVMHAGIPVATVRGKREEELMPAHGLALSAALNREAFPRVELSYREALDYLRGLSLVLPGDTPRGYVLVGYHGVALGFVKNIGQRANNLYPDAWRIRTTHLPAEEVGILDIKQ